MTAIEALRHGDVSAALEHVKDDVRSDPQEGKHRIFLFQLFTIVGEWDRAMAQLKVASELDHECKPMADAYQHILQCEALREQVFQGQRSPLIFGEPEAWMAKMLEALRLSAEGRYEAASALRSEAFDEAEPASGTLTLRDRGDEAAEKSDGFEWIADSDSRIGPFLEVVLQGKFYWVPFTRIEHIAFHEVADLRDYVWIAAQFRWAGGGEMVGMIPVRYPQSQNNADGLVQLARKTLWDQKDESTFLGQGQRMFATDQNDFAILDIAEILFIPCVV